ncbi:MAG: hypothetical protein GXO97_01400, partial [Nitrospirae bacterium]|nr:hypothetical protein [Nitrospirota bacterium]
MNRGSLKRYNDFYRVCVLFFIVLILLSSCAGISEQRVIRGENYGRITVVLEVKDKIKKNITFKLSGISIVNEKGGETGLIEAPLIINSYDLKGRQIVIAEKMIPEGRYKRLRIFLKEPSITSKGRISSLAYSNVPVDLDLETIVYRKKNTMVFIQWSPDSSVEEGYRFSPLFTLKAAPPDIS